MIACIKEIEVDATERVLITNDGKTTVTTRLSDTEATEILRKSTAGFAKSLLQKYAFCGRWTTNQLVWVHRLALETLDPPREPEGVDLGDFTKIAQMFDAAAVKLKYPKVVFDFEDQPITLYRAGARSKHPGSIQVTDGGKYGDNQWYGRIERSGKFAAITSCPEEIKQFLKMFAADPAGVAASYGKSQGACCFCQKQLTDERSVAAGFGPQCAKHYHLEQKWKEAYAKSQEANHENN